MNTVGRGKWDSDDKKRVEEGFWDIMLRNPLSF